MRSLNTSCLLLSVGVSACGVFGTGDSAVFPLDSDAESPTCDDSQAAPIKVWDCDTGAGYSIDESSLSSGSPEVHVIGIYDSSAPDTYLRTGLADVNVTRTGAPIVLVLSAYEPTSWKVTAASGVVLDRIVLLGYHQQSADAPAGVPVDVLAATGTCDLVYGIYEHPACQAALLNFLESAAGAPVTSIATCYKASEFSLGTGNCQEQPAPRSHCDPTCGGLPPGPHECKRVTDNGDVVSLEVESGAETVLGNIGSGLDLFSSMAIDGDYILYCSEDFSGLTRASIIDGSRTHLGGGCAAITNYQGGFLVLDRVAGEYVTHYPSYADLELGNGTQLPIPTYASRIAVHGDTLLTAWHSTYEIQLYSLSTYAQLGTIELEGFNTWIWGMSVTEDGVLFVNSDWPEDRIAAFDVVTGGALANFDLTTNFSSGLSCTSPR